MGHQMSNHGWPQNLFKLIAINQIQHLHHVLFPVERSNQLNIIDLVKLLFFY